MIKLKRVYEGPSPKDGLRFLVERLWPRLRPAKERAGRGFVPEGGVLEQMPDHLDKDE